MEFEPGGQGRMAVALAVLGLLATLAYATMEPDRVRSLVFVLLGFFAVRVVLGRARSR